MYAKSSSKTKASATVSPYDRKLTWSIQGDDLGCKINANTGDIISGTKPGVITVRAADSEFPESAYADAKLIVYTVTLKNKDSLVIANDSHISRQGSQAFIDFDIMPERSS